MNRGNLGMDHFNYTNCITLVYALSFCLENRTISERTTINDNHDKYTSNGGCPDEHAVINGEVSQAERQIPRFLLVFSPL
jgi:hypothetical protein